MVGDFAQTSKVPPVLSWRAARVSLIFVVPEVAGQLHAAEAELAIMSDFNYPSTGFHHITVFLTGALPTIICITPTPRLTRERRSPASPTAVSWAVRARGSVAKGTLPFWVDRHAVKHTGIQEGFGQKVIYMKRPAGLGFEVMEDSRDTRKGWKAGDVPAEASAVGFNTSTFSVGKWKRKTAF
jgi:hypothetical protein